jgi:23S rRNA pseudouridine2457 synthase
MKLILFNKPFGVICQFSEHPERPALAQYLPFPNIYPAGRLDADSEGLLLLTDDGKLQHEIAHPARKQEKTYLVQVEGQASEPQLARLRQGLDLGDFHSAACHASRAAEPDWLWPRTPPVRYRANVATDWLLIRLSEGKNRQVRRMTAAVGLPTLRLVRTAIGPISLASHPLLPGEWRELSSSEWRPAGKS